VTYSLFNSEFGEATCDSPEIELEYYSE
jgi:hypothetical protein